MQQSRGPITPSEMFRPPEQSDQYSQGDGHIAMQGTNARNSITVRMLQQKMTRQSQQTNNSKLYQANPFPGLGEPNSEAKAGNFLDPHNISFPSANNA